MNHRSETVRILRTVLALVAGNALYSLTVVLFLIPSGLITGGATGIALAANRLIGLPVSGVLLLVNVVMLVAGWILLGRRFALSTLASTFLSPLTLAIWEELFQDYVLTDDLILCTIFAGLGIGVSLGIVIRTGGSTGGMDIPPLVLQKYFRIPVAVSMTVFDLAILLAQAVSSPKEQVLYGIVLVFVYSTVLDKVIMLGEENHQHPHRRDPLGDPLGTGPGRHPAGRRGRLSPPARPAAADRHLQPPASPAGKTGPRHRPRLLHGGQRGHRGPGPGVLPGKRLSRISKIFIIKTNHIQFLKAWQLFLRQKKSAVPNHLLVGNVRILLRNKIIFAIVSNFYRQDIPNS